jgi:hypothetical protein
MMGGRWSAAASVNLAKTGQLSRNAACPCGSGKKYKRCVLFLSFSKSGFLCSFQTWFALVGTRLQPAVLQVASLGPHLSVQIGS